MDEEYTYLLNQFEAQEGGEREKDKEAYIDYNNVFNLFFC